MVRHICGIKWDGVLVVTCLFHVPNIDGTNWKSVYWTEVCCAHPSPVSTSSDLLLLVRLGYFTSEIETPVYKD